MRRPKEEFGDYLPMRTSGVQLGRAENVVCRTLSASISLVFSVGSGRDQVRERQSIDHDICRNPYWIRQVLGRFAGLHRV